MVLIALKNYIRGRQLVNGHTAGLRTVLDRFESGEAVVHRWGTELAAVFVRGGRLLVGGNGGSAAQAQHLAAELVGRYRHDRRPFSAICLSAEPATLTAITNDYSAEESFARQVEAHGRRGDVLALLSTSGTSPNVVAAARRGRELGMTVWVFTGPAPNPLASCAHEALVVDAPLTANVQELHLVALHLMCEALDDVLGTAQDASAQDATIEVLGA